MGFSFVVFFRSVFLYFSSSFFLKCCFWSLLFLLYLVGLVLLSLLCDWFIYKFQLCVYSDRDTVRSSPGSYSPPIPVTWRYYCSVKYGYFLCDGDKEFREDDRLIVFNALNYVSFILIYYSVFYWGSIALLL